MNIFELMRFFLPLQNPVGFGLIDFIEVGAAALMVIAILTRDSIGSAMRWVAERPGWSMAFLFALPIVLRLLLLRTSPIPTPTVSDDFSYLLLGDTLAHLRLANPMHPMRRFFETVFVLQEPSYSSIYPLGQGLVLAIGEVLFRLPWAGVALSIGALCACCYWMLRAWVTPVWALAGGVLAAMEFGPLNQWMNNYWGGAISAIAGCLVFGALPRLWRNPRRREAVLLGAGFGLQVLTRPFESLLLAVCVLPALFFVRRTRRLGVLPAWALLALMPAIGLTMAHNKAATGNWTTLPYMLSRYQYGVPASFTFQPMPEPHRDLTQEQKLDYQAQKEVHNEADGYFPRLASRIRFFRFFFYAPLYAALLFFVPSMREQRYRWVAVSIAVFTLGTNIYPYYYPHYIAAMTCLFVLVSIASLERLWRLQRDATLLLALLTVACFAFWYGIHLFGNEQIFAATGPYESWDYINFGDAEGRIAVNRQLAGAPGKQLVFVRYGPQHLLREWVRNDADIDASRVVWALDLGESEDAALMRYYPGRTVWVVEPDARPVRLSRYER